MSDEDPEHEDVPSSDRDERDDTQHDAYGERAQKRRGDSWTRSFPQGTIEGDDWMVDVLDDLHAYARTHDLEEIADTLSETRRMVIAHLLATRH